MNFFEDPAFIKKLEGFKMVIKNQARGLRFGENRSKNYGHGLEVSHLKNYSPGEDIKFIDWNASFRLNKTYLKVFSQTKENNIYIMIDRSASMDFGDGENKMETKYMKGLMLAYAVSYVCATGFNRVFLLEFSNYILRSNEITRNNINIKFNELIRNNAGGNIQASGNGGNFDAGGINMRRTLISKSLHDFFVNFKRKGALFCISDFIDSDLSVIENIPKIALLHNFYLVHTVCSDDRQIPALGEFKYEDAETGEFIEVSMTPAIAEEYSRKFNGFSAQIAGTALKHGGNYIMLNASDDVFVPLKEIFMKSVFYA